jgi:PGF-pre-PGF domain-containing protein
MKEREIHNFKNVVPFRRTLSSISTKAHLKATFALFLIVTIVIIILKINLVGGLGSVEVGTTNLTIWDSSDDQIVYSNWTVIYANYTDTTTGDSINGSGVWCDFSHNKTGTWTTPINMTFNPDTLQYELIADGSYLANHTSNLPYGFYSFNISCYDANHGSDVNLSATDEINISEYETSLAITNETGKLVNQDVTFTANYSSLDFGDVGRVMWNSSNLGSVRGVTFFDCQNDGHKDCPVASSSEDLWLYYPNGSLLRQATDPGSYAYQIVSADLDGDGYENEIIIAEDRGIVFNETGDNLWNTSTGIAPFTLAVADLDNDGVKNDLVFGNGSNLFVYLNSSSDATNWSLSWTTDICDGVTSGIQEIAIGDLDRDGHQNDIAIVDLTIGNIIAFTGNNGSILFNTTDLGISYSVEVADLDNDGFKDEVIAGTNGGSIRAYTWNGTWDALYSDQASDYIWKKNVLQNNVLELGVLDLDDDGLQDDIVASDSGTTTFGVIGLNNNSDTLWYFNETFNAADVIDVMVVGDIDGDGMQDIVFSELDTDFIYVLNKSGNEMWNYTISAGDIGHASNNFGKHKALDISDVNNDGIKDIAVASSGGFLHVLNDMQPCQIAFNDSEGMYDMDWNWNSTPMSIWAYNRTFTTAGDYEWNVTCAKNGYISQVTSGIVSIVTAGNNAPSTPDLNAPDNNTYLLDTDLVVPLNWSNSTDADGDAITYYLEVWNESETLNIMYVNSSIAETANTTGDIVNFPNETNADFFWRVLATDGTANSSWSELRNISIGYTTADTTPPTLNIDYPIAFANLSSSDVTFNFTVVEANIDSCELYGNWSGGWHLNQTLVNPSTDVTTNFTTITLDEGVYFWNVECNDTSSNSAFNDSNFTFTIDLTPPSVYLELPENNTYNDTSNTIDFTYNVSDSSDLVNCSLIINDAINITDTGMLKDTAGQNLTTYLPNGDYNWSVNCTDLVNNIGTSDVYNISINNSMPQIISVSGTVSEGINITISGTGFGTKSTATPLFYDNFDSNDAGRQNGNTIPTKNASHYGIWSSSSGSEVATYTNTNQRGISTLSSYVHFWSEESHNSGFIQTNLTDSHIPIVFFSYWIRISYANESGDGNVKMTKFLDTSGNYGDTHDNLQDAWQLARAPNEAYMNVWATRDAQPSVWPDNSGSVNLGYHVPFDEWYHLIWFRKAGTSGNSDGSEWVIVNGVTLKNTNLMHNYETGNEWAILAICGNYIANYATMDVYVQCDDIYIDNTWQSVWVGDASTWDNSTHREIQIPTEWSDEEINVTLNQGSFLNGSTVYLFVVNSDGNTSDGYPVILEGPTPPSITLNEPADYYNSNSETVNFNASVTDTVTIGNVSLWHNFTSWDRNETNSSGGNQDYLFNANFTEGQYIWAIEACDDSANCTFSENRTFTIDLTAPTVNLELPENNTLNTTTNTLDFAYNVTDFSDLVNCSLIINDEINVTDTSMLKDTAGRNLTTYLPNADYEWSVNCTDILNNVGASETRNISINVAAANTNPLFEPISDFAEDEDFAQFTIKLQDNVSDSEDADASLTYNWTVNDTNILTFDIVNTTGIATFTSQPNASGNALITISVVDTGGLSNSTEFTLTVNAVNDAPFPVDLNEPVNESMFEVLGEFNWSNTTDIDSEVIYYVLQIGDSPEFTEPVAYYNGSVTETDNTTEDYPSGLAYGVYFWRVLATDAIGNSSWSEVRMFNYSSPNNVPSFEPISDDFHSEDFGQFNMDVSANVSDAEDSDSSLLLTVTNNNTEVVTVSAVDNATSTVTFDSVANASGSASINITVWDTGGEQNSSTFDFVVSAVNDQPWGNGSLDNVTEDEDFVFLDDLIPVADFNANFSDVEENNAPTTYTIIAQQNATTSCYFDGSNNLDCESVANQSGIDNYTIQLNDSGLLSVTFDWQITVSSVDDIPWLELDKPDDDATNTTSNSIDFTYTPHDVENNIVNCSLIIDGLINVTDESITIDVINNLTTYLDNADYNWTVNCTDESNGITNAVQRDLTVNVGAANTNPLFEPISSFSLDEDFGTLELNLQLNVSDGEDADADLVYNWTDNNTNLLTLDIVNATGVATFSSVANQSGSADIVISVVDTGGLSNSTSFVLTVNAVNDVPWWDLIGNATYSMNEDTSSYNLSALAYWQDYFRDVENDQNPSGTNSATDNSSDVSCSLTNGDIICTTSNNATGSFALTITAEDEAGGNSIIQSVEVGITGVNDLPWIDLDKPDDNATNTTTNNIDFTYTPRDVESSLTNCSLIINDQVNLTGTTITVDEVNNLTVYLTNGEYNWSVNCTDDGNNIAASLTRNLSINFVPDTTAPTIAIESPEDNATNTTTNALDFTYNVSDDSTLSNCTLIIDDVINVTDATIQKDTAGQTLTTTLSNGEYNWSVNCTDESNNIGGSETRNVSVNYVPATTISPSLVGGDSGTRIEGTGRQKETVTLEVATPGPEFFEFTKDIGIRSITLIFNRRVTNPLITVEKLADRPASLPMPEGRTYSLLQITKNIGDEDFDGVVIEFAVPRSWLVRKGVLPDEIRLKRFSQEWTTLPTKMMSSDGDNYYYEAESTGMSYFAIGTEEELAMTQPVAEEPKDTVPEITEGLSEADQKEIKQPGKEESGLPTHAVLIAILLVLLLAASLLWLRHVHTRKKKMSQKEPLSK